MEKINFEGKEYPLILLDFPFGERKISSEKLNENLMSLDGRYVSEKARLIDEGIFYFVSEDHLKLDKVELAKLILSEI